MYDISDVLADTELSPGSNILIAGPPMVGKQAVGFDILAQGTRGGEGAIIVSTKDGAETVRKEYAALVDDIDAIPFGVVDCVSQQQGMRDTSDTDRVKYASSPVDMTGIGIKLSELLEYFYEHERTQQNRILLHSISTLLMYSDLQTVFRFLHVLTGRVTSADALGLYVIDPSTHDEQAMNTLKQLFDGMIHIEETDSGRSIRGQGLPTV